MHRTFIDNSVADRQRYILDRLLSVTMMALHGNKRERRIETLGVSRLKNQSPLNRNPIFSGSIRERDSRTAPFVSSRSSSPRLSV